MKTGFAKDALAKWFDFNYPLLYTYVNKTDLDAPAGRAASIHLDMPAHAVAISAWEHENKLEIIVIDTTTDESKVEDKAYASRDKLQARLDALLKQLLEMCE